VKVLFPGEGSVRGPKASALIEFVREQPGVPKADAILAGFSSAIIARAIKAGAIREEEVAPARQRSVRELGPPPFPPTLEQQRAIDSLLAQLAQRRFQEALLYGITGSGKTYVYIEAIKQVLRDGGRAIVLVPEISLTPQTARRFEEAFGERVAVLHSALSDRERFDAWQACANGEVDVVVGARSAVFAPLQDVRLMVVDEAHESSYKQDTSPRYHAVRVARERMRLENGVLLLGSATPSLESYADATEGRIELFVLNERATRQPLPVVHVVDMAQEFEAGNRRIFSTRLAQALDDRLERREKTVLFVNRRGSAGFLLCRSCGFVPECRRCSVSLTVHRAEGLLRCHYCDAQRAIPSACERCGSETVKEFGVGTQRVAEEVQRLYSGARVIRMDSDTTTRVGDHARLLDAFASEGDILVGTQMVAKGLDFPTVTLVGVIAADIGLHAPEFRAAERTFGLVTQVCGRSGRARPGEAIVQTYSPQHPAIVFAAAHDYAGFAKHELTERRATMYPPACELIYLGVIGRNRSKTLVQAQRYAEALEKAGRAEVLGPAPYPIARLNDEWRFRIALKASDGSRARNAVREHVLPLARAEKQTRLVVNVDP
jgi:primosomal protein N' (replication factor Y)